MEAVTKNILIIAIVVLILAIMWATYQYIKFYKTEHFVSVASIPLYLKK